MLPAWWCPTARSSARALRLFEEMAFNAMALAHLRRHCGSASLQASSTAVTHAGAEHAPDEF